MTRFTKITIRSLLGAAAVATLVLGLIEPASARMGNEGGGGTGGAGGGTPTPENPSGGSTNNGISLNGTRANGWSNGTAATVTVIDFGAVTVSGVTMPVPAASEAE